MGLVKVGLAFLQPEMKDERNEPRSQSFSPSLGGRPSIPLAKLVRMDAVSGRDLGQRIFFLEQFQHEAGFLVGRVAFADHGQSVP